MTRPYTAIVIELPDDEGIVTITRKRAPAGDGASLKFLQGAVGGYIEHLCTPYDGPANTWPGKLDFWMNEEGKLVGLPINNVATDFLWSVWPAFRGEDVLCGNVVLTGNKAPENADVPNGVWERLKAMPWLVTVVFVDEAEESAK